MSLLHQKCKVVPVNVMNEYRMKRNSVEFSTTYLPCRSRPYPSQPGQTPETLLNFPPRTFPVAVDLPHHNLARLQTLC